MDKEFISVKNIVMEFASADMVTRVLDDINLTIKKNKLTMIVGPSGCGKTTLISIITAMLTPTSGSVFFEGREVFALSNLEKTLLRQKNIGFVFQQYNLLSTLTASENVSVPLLAAKMPFQEANKRAVRILQAVGLDKHMNQLPSSLSGGEQQRVAVARSLVHEPQFIVCDEPTASLDQENGKKIMDNLKKISQNQDRAVLVVTHDNRIFSYADEIIYMNDGKIVDIKYNKKLIKKTKTSNK